MICLRIHLYFLFLSSRYVSRHFRCRCQAKMASQKKQRPISDFFQNNISSKKRNTNDDSVVDPITQTEDERDTISSSSSESTSDCGVKLQTANTSCGASRINREAGQSQHITSAQAVTTRTPAAGVNDEKPNQPNITFPGRRFGNETFERSLQYSWFGRWRWLHYVTDKDCVLCFTCNQAVAKGLAHLNTDNHTTFSKEGFSNWKKAREKFTQHELSDIHSNSVCALATLKSTPINAMLSDLAAREQNTARTVLELLFRTIKFLGREGIPLRGHTHRDGILWQLMLERTHSLPQAREWMMRRDNWMSDTTQNEILEMFAHAIQREIVSDSQHGSFFGLTADGTTDISACEQFSCCLQFVDADLKAQNVFLGFYNAHDSSAETLFACIKDIFLRLNIPLERMQGYCFDGASNMSGHISGVQARLKAECPESLYVHCSNHALDLVLQEVAREVRLIADTLNFVQGVSVVIRESPKRTQLFRSLFGSEEVVCNILGLCPTRWCIRTAAISRVIAAYTALLETLKALEQDRTVRAETRAKISGLYRQGTQARTYFGLVCSEALFAPCEAVARSLQSKTSTARAALESVRVLQQRMQGLREENAVKQLMEKVKTYAGANSLRMPQPCRVSKTPARIRCTTEPEALVSDYGEAQWRRHFIEAVDLIQTEIGRRFDQVGMKVAAQRETTLIDAANQNLSGLNEVQLPEKFDRARLQMQLTLLGDLTKGRRFISVAEVAECVSALHPETRQLFKEVELFVELCLCLPVSAAPSERSFSALRRLKTWLRSTMSQKRLTHLALMQVHSNILDRLDIGSLVRSFIRHTPERKATFGAL